MLDIREREIIYVTCNREEREKGITKFNRSLSSRIRYLALSLARKNDNLQSIYLKIKTTLLDIKY